MELMVQQLYRYRLGFDVHGSLAKRRATLVVMEIVDRCLAYMRLAARPCQELVNGPL